MESPIPVTRTRILLPRRRGDLLSRQRLLHLLYELMDNKLNIIAAPAGYGKTSLLIDFANHIEYPVCWYAIDTLDRDLLRFLAYFISALNVRFPSFGEASMTALRNALQGEFNLDRITTTIVNDAYEHISEHFVVVLDDYHLVDGSKQVDQFVSRFIQDVDENCHLVIASRTLLTLPDFPLMVARSQVGGLSFEELAFVPEELQALLLQNYQASLSLEASQGLIYQTEGWITGLLLSTQAIQQNAPDRRRVAKVSGVGLSEYLEQVIIQQRAEIQTFLLRSSLLEEFDAKLCEEVIGGALSLEGEPWNEYIEEVVRSNLFVLLVGEERIWLRYHHLFRDFLQARMQRNRPEETRLIQQELAEYYARREDWESAYRFYHQLGDVAGKARLIEQAGTPMVSGGRVKLLAEWLEALPRDLLASRPALLSIKGVVWAALGNTAQSIELFDQAIESLRRAGQNQLLARTLTRRAFTYHALGDYIAAIKDAEEVLTLLDGSSDSEWISVDAWRAKGFSFYHQGNLNDALALLQKALEISQSSPERPIESIILMEIGLVQQARGDFAAAERFYVKALDHLRSTDNILGQANVLNNLGFLQYLRGDYEAATSTLEKALQHARIAGSPRLEAYAYTNIGDLYRDLQALDEAQEAYRQAYEIAQRTGDRFLMVYLELAEATLSRVKKDFERARQRLEIAWERARMGGSQYEQSLCALEDGALKVAQGLNAEAIEPLRQAREHLEANDHKLEAARACLYLSFAEFDQQLQPAAGDHLQRAFRLAGEPEKQQPLVTVGLWEKERVKAMKAEKELAATAGQYLRLVRQLEQRLPVLRRRLRQQASDVPFAPARLIIRALGRVQVRLNERTITMADWQTKIARDLFFMLLAHPEGMTKEMIGAIFWPEISPEELKLRFKNTIYRVRHAAGKETIILQDDYYRFNRGLDYEYDVEEFLKAIQQAQKARTPKEQISCYKAALRLYRGPYLPESEETWNLSERERLFQYHIETLLKLAEIHLEGGQLQAALSYSQRALGEDPCLEAAHRLAMRTHAAMGNRAAVARQYERCRQALLEEINALPSPQTQLLHDTLMH